MSIIREDLTANKCGLDDYERAQRAPEVKNVRITGRATDKGREVTYLSCECGGRVFEFKQTCERAHVKARLPEALGSRAGV